MKLYLENYFIESSSCGVAKSRYIQNVYFALIFVCFEVAALVLML